MEHFKFEGPSHRDYFVDFRERFCFNTAHIHKCMRTYIRTYIRNLKFFDFSRRLAPVRYKNFKFFMFLEGWSLSELELRVFRGFLTVGPRQRWNFKFLQFF